MIQRTLWSPTVTEKFTPRGWASGGSWSVLEDRIQGQRGGAAQVPRVSASEPMKASPLGSGPEAQAALVYVRVIGADEQAPAERTGRDITPDDDPDGVAAELLHCIEMPLDQALVGVK